MTSSIAFTGHRPKDLPVGYGMSALSWQLDTFFRDQPDMDVTHFYVGGALGVDSWVAEWAIRNDIPFTLALPFQPGVMSLYWPDHAKDRLATHISKASNVQIIHDHPSYDVRAYQLRNEFMVDNSSEVIAFWTGKPAGGTANCIRYALSKGRLVRNLLPGPYQGQIKEV